MPSLTTSTKSQKVSEVQRRWHLVDLKGQVLGRAAVAIAHLIQGKQKPTYSPSLDAGDYVVAINAKEIVLTGRKLLQKTYSRYSGYPGGQTVQTAQELLSKKPGELIRHAVSGMLPKNKLRQPRLTRLYIYADGNHPHAEKFTQDLKVKAKTQN